MLPDGQVRPRLPEDAEHRLQRPALHGQRRGRQQEGVRHRPRRQPVDATSRWPRSSGSAAPTSPSARRSPPSYVWQARENGAQDHRRRSAHHADRPHLRPVPADQARPRRRPVQRHPAPDDRERLARPRLHRAATPSASSRSAEHVTRVDAAADGRGDRHRRAGDPPGGRVVGHGEDELPAARPRHRAPQPRRAERAWARSTSCWPRAGSAGRAAATRRSPARATARAAASTARSATSSPAAATSRTPSTARHVAAVWGVAEPTSCRAPGVDCYEIFRKVEPRRDQGPAVASASTRSCRCPTATSSSGCWRSSSSSSAIDFFLSETARLRRRRAARLAARGGRGDRHARPRGGSSRSTRPSTRPGDARQDWRIIQDIAAALGRERGFTFAEPARDLRRAAAGVARAASPTTRASPTRRSSAQMRRLLAVPDATTTRARRGCSSRARGTRSPRAPGRSTSPTARPASTSPPYAPPAEDVDAEYPVILTTGRVVSQFLSGHADAAHRPAGRPVPRAALELHPQLAEQARHRRRRLGDGRVAARRAARCGPGGDDDPARHGLRALPLGRARRASTGDDRGAGPDLEDPRVQGLRRPRSQGRRSRPSTPRSSSRSSRRREDGARCRRRALEFFIDPGRCIGCQACVHACAECDTHKGHSMIHLEYVDRAALDADGAGRLHALRLADLRRGLPGRRHQADRRTAWCRRPASRAASPATTACWPARSACPR